MSDPRLTPFNGRVAHTSLQGQVDAKVFTDGTVKRVWYNVVDLMDEPQGRRQCQLLYGEAFRVLDEDEHYCFGMREHDGYVGWVGKPALKEFQRSPFEKTELKVAVQRAPCLVEPDIKSQKNLSNQHPLSFGSLLWHRPFGDEAKERTHREEGWLCALMQTSHIPTGRFVRWSHVVLVDQFGDDPAGIAELFIHTPYLWGGDSSHGIDCSGLVQRALMACGKACPRDSDMQFDHFGRIDPSEITRNDLVFWKGHVGMMLDEKRLIHANAYHMMVAIEPLDQAIDRIGRKEFGDVLGFARA